MTISVQSGLLGVRKVYLSVPGLSEPFVTYWQDEATLLQIRTPSGDGNVLHKYTALGLLRKTASGDSLSLYDYNDENLLTGVTHTREGKFTLKITLVRNLVKLPKGKYLSYIGTTKKNTFRQKPTERESWDQLTIWL